MTHSYNEQMCIAMMLDYSDCYAPYVKNEFPPPKKNQYHNNWYSIKIDIIHGITYRCDIKKKLYTCNRRID